jgi:hypothetical protein
MSRRGFNTREWEVVLDPAGWPVVIGRVQAAAQRGAAQAALKLYGHLLVGHAWNVRKPKPEGGPVHAA